MERYPAGYAILSSDLSCSCDNDGSEINANPKDTPGVKDIVWRLPPTLMTSREDESLRKQMLSIGESDRMTLKFRKP